MDSPDIKNPERNDMEGPDEEMAEMVYELQNMVELVKTMVLEGQIMATNWTHAEIEEGGQKVAVAEIDWNGREYLFMVLQHEEEGKMCTIVSKVFSDLEIFIPAPTEIFMDRSASKVIGKTSFSEDWG